jgi:hypothetical protein
MFRIQVKFFALKRISFANIILIYSSVKKKNMFEHIGTDPELSEKPDLEK